MGPRRILYVEQPTHVGGSVISLLGMVKALDQNRYEPVVLFHGPNPYRARFESAGVATVTLSEQDPAALPPHAQSRGIAARLGRRTSAAYSALKSLYTLARRDRPVARAIEQAIVTHRVDLVHLNNNMHGNRAGVLAAWRAGRRCVCHVRTLEQLELADRLLLGRVHRFIYISRAVAATYAAQDVRPDRGLVIPNAVDLASFGGVKADPALRRELGIGPDAAVVGSLSRLDWWKGHDILLQAMAQVIRSVPNARALIVGDAAPTTRNQAYWERLMSLVDTLGLKQHVIFTGYRSDVPRLLGVCDVAVHSATEPEPFGRVIIEAMAAGVPVVAAKAGGVLDIVEDGVDGLLVQPADPAALAQAILALLRDRERARRLSATGQRRVRERFGVQQQAAAIQAVYDDVLNGARRASLWMREPA